MNLQPSMLAAESERSLFRQVADVFRGAITSGSLRPGAQMPVQKDVARSLAVGIKTVNDAYTLLRGEGMIVGGRGKPNRVRPLPPLRTVSTARYTKQIERLRTGRDPVLFTDDFGAAWETYSVETEYTVSAAAGFVASQTGWQPDTPVLVRHLTHKISGEPVQIHISTLKHSVANGTILADPSAQPVRGGIFAELHRIGRLPTHWREHRRARLCQGPEPRALGIGERVPVYDWTRLLWHESDVIEISQLITPTDRVIWMEEGEL